MGGGLKARVQTNCLRRKVDKETVWRTGSQNLSRGKKSNRRSLTSNKGDGKWVILVRISCGSVLTRCRSPSLKHQVYILFVPFAESCSEDSGETSALDHISRFLVELLRNRHTSSSLCDSFGHPQSQQLLIVYLAHGRAIVDIVEKCVTNILRNSNKMECKRWAESRGRESKCHP